MEPLIVPGVLDSLSDIAAYVMSAAATAGLDKKIAYRLRLAIDEIATNIITHGYEENGLSGNIEVQAKINGSSLTIELVDTGPVYNPQLDQTPDSLDLSLEERPIGGLGVYLAARNVDKLLVYNAVHHTFCKPPTRETKQ
jgi:serine/threonine-protein kinase RsbW